MRYTGALLLAVLILAGGACADVRQTADHWDRFYERAGKQQETKNWFLEFSQLRDTLQPMLGETSNVLIAGAGTSSLPLELARACPRCAVAAADFSKVAVDAMDARLGKDAPRNLLYFVADVTDMPDVPDRSVDLVVDKGTMDAIAADTRDPQTHVRAELREFHRILRDGGRVLVVSIETPEAMREHVRHTPFAAEHKLAQIDGKLYWLYVLAKGSAMHTRVLAGGKVLVGARGSTGHGEL